MATENGPIGARVDRWLATSAPRPSIIPRGGLTPAPAPGYRFPIGARVLETVDGKIGTVAAQYGAAAANVRVYELTVAGGEHLVRVEEQLEPAPASVRAAAAAGV
jgi:hypothetical protein